MFAATVNHLSAVVFNRLTFLVFSSLNFLVNNGLTFLVFNSLTSTWAEETAAVFDWENDQLAFGFHSCEL